MAWVMARTWASVNEPRSDEPRCPLVPKLTRCSGSSRSGRRSKYSRSRRARSTSISLGAGFPARGEMVMYRSFSWRRTRLHSPDFGGMFGDCVVAGELPPAGHVQDGLARPRVAVGVQRGQPLVRLEIRFEVGQRRVLSVIGAVGQNPALRQHIPHRTRGCLEALARPGGFRSNDVVEKQVPLVQSVI